MKKLVSLLTVSTLLLAACGTGSKSASTAQSGTKEVKQEIAVSTPGELSTLDSAQYTDVNSSDMIGQVTEGLYRLDKNGDPELAMAKEKPKISEDGLTYTFKIRNAQYSDGTPVKAGDFVYAFQTVVDPATASSASSRMDIFKNASKIRSGKLPVDQLGVEAKDDQTLVLHLENPAPFLPEILTGTPFMPKQQAFAQEKGKAYGTSAENFVGNGPFILKDWNGNNESWTLEKNPKYWDKENVRLEKINVQVVKEIATGVNLFNDGQLDYTLLSDVYAQNNQDNPLAHFAPKATVGYISANQKRPVTGNVHVRQAILQAINKASFTKNVLADGSKPLNGFVPANFAKNPKTGEDYRKEAGNFMSYDLKAAQKAWETAKKELGQDKIHLELLASDTAVSKKIVEFLQGQLQQNLPGLTIDIKNVPLQNRLDLQTAGDFDLVYGTWTPDYADPINFLEFYESTGGLNSSGYVNKDYDAGLVEVRTTLANNPAKRWQKLIDLEKTLIEEDTAVLPFYQGSVAYLQSKRLKDLQVFPFGRTVSYRLAYVSK